MSYSERDEMIVILIDQGLESRKLRFASDGGGGEAGSSVVCDSLNCDENWIDNVRFLPSRQVSTA